MVEISTNCHLSKQRWRLQNSQAAYSPPRKKFSLSFQRAPPKTIQIILIKHASQPIKKRLYHSPTQRWRHKQEQISGKPPPLEIFTKNITDKRNARIDHTLPAWNIEIGIRSRSSIKKPPQSGTRPHEEYENTTIFHVGILEEILSPVIICLRVEIGKFVRSWLQMHIENLRNRPILSRLSPREDWFQTLWGIIHLKNVVDQPK